MKLRGRRRCAECGRRWSYFETGTATCPECGSLLSVSVDGEASLHTDGPAGLDLAPARDALDDESLQAAAERARSAARKYVRSRGFVRGGQLLDLDDTYLAAAELTHVAAHLRRTLEPDERAEAYFLSLLAGAEDGDRPDGVPDSLRWARALATAEAVEAYRRDVGRWLEEHPDPAASSLLGQLRSHERRVAALDGDVPPGDPGTLATAARCIGRFLREGDEDDLGEAEDALEALG